MITISTMRGALLERKLARSLLAGLMLFTGSSATMADDSDSWATAPMEWSRKAYDWVSEPFMDDSDTRDQGYGDNVEQTRIDMDGATKWELKDDGSSKGDKLEVRQVKAEDVKTVKLQNVVPPIYFASGEAKIPEEYVAKLRDVLDKMRDRRNVRLHFVGHTDNARLSPDLKFIYGDNVGLSRERAGTVAEFFQRSLHLPPESISYEGLGDSKPVATNATEAGRAKNRRVEVEVWYDEVSEKKVNKEVLVSQQMKRIRVCRMETVCKLRYKIGHKKRAKVKNLVAPLHYDEASTTISENFLRQIRQALDNLSSKQNVVVRFIGYTDNLPLSPRDARIYGNHLALSRARARRVALAVKDALGLPSSAVESDGKGEKRPIASNATEKGRMLNRRVEVEFWYDDPLASLPDEPQMCPDQSGSETVTRTYDPPSGPIPAVYFNGGQPVIPPGYSQRLQRLMAEVGDKANVRLRFVGYTADKRLSRRAAAIYGDDIGLSTARARRVMEKVRSEIGLTDAQVEYEGHGYVQTDDVVNAGFVESDRSRVTVEVIYDELALIDDNEGLDITRMTREVEPQNPYSLNLMRITVDGKPLDDPKKSVADVQRCTDVAMDHAHIQFKYDNLKFKPRLNVTAWPTTIRFKDDFNTSAIENRVRFKLYSNFRSFFEKAEVRLFDSAQSTRSQPLAVVPLNADGEGEWRAEFKRYSAPGRKLKYVLRVYDDKGRYDETQPQILWVVDKVDTEKLAHADANRELLTGYGETRLATQQIPLNGGSIEVYGDSVPGGDSVWVAGRPVPLGKDHKFVVEELLPAGLHTVEVAVLNKKGNGDLYLRDLQLKKNDWFYVGIADFSVAKDSTNGPAKLVTNNNTYDGDFSTNGRLAFFTDGKFGKDWELTASADTRENQIDSLFSNFLDKTPSAMFRRINPDYYYPTFGDDSTVEQEAPTLGKFYVKLKKQEDYGLWGNFKVDYTENDFAQVDRTLYGSNLHLQSGNTTKFGDRRYTVDGFVADPGTIASRDEFQGTDGSLYYLRHQDILQGSERIRVEVRDKDSGLVLAVKNLVAGLDYDIDYIQGRVLLTEPLSASYANSMLIQSDGSGNNQAYLVARYEYTPGFNELNTMAVGGQAHYWFGDSVRLGMSSNHNDQGDANGSVDGVDVTLRKSTETWVKVEASRTEGPGVDTLNSSDGGFTFGRTSVTAQNARASGYRVDSAIALKDLHKKLSGKMTAYAQTREAGFAAPGQQTTRDVNQYGGTLAMPVGGKVKMRGKLDVMEQDQGLQTTATEVDVDYLLSDAWTVSSGLRQDDRTDNSPIVPLTQEEGRRTDLRVQAAYDSKANWTAYSFIQGTVATTGNRDNDGAVGAGGAYRITDRFSVNGEVSGGDLGPLGRFGTEYLYSDRTSIYTTYSIENERTDNGVRARKGSLVTGMRTRYSDTTSVYLEERYTHGDVPTGLTHSTGVDMAPNDRWNYGANIDLSTLKDHQTAATIDRKAFNAKVGYHFKKTTFASALEYRVDDSENPDTATTSRRKTWLSKNSAKIQLSDDWRLVGKLNWSESKSSLGDFYDGNFTEAVVGFAYRPIESDRLNALLKYTYFYNLPASDQVTVLNTPVEYVQKSHVLSADVTLDLTKRWTIGGKVAFRRGELSLDRVNPEFFRSDAYLYVARLQWHVLYHWDLLVEGRLLDLPDARDRRTGILAGIYRQVGNNLKIGVAYNAADFSDDLTDLSYNSKGFFINAIGKF